MQGTVKFYLREKNFGFVTCEAGDWFFHRGDILGDEPLLRDEEVEFDLSDGMRDDLVAVNVRRHVGYLHEASPESANPTPQRQKV
jgi:cold shock CspA family protein